MRVRAAVVGAVRLPWDCPPGVRRLNPRPGAGNQPIARATVFAEPVEVVLGFVVGPLSPFENNPAVMVLRAWSAQVAKDFNAGQNYTDRALTAMEVPSFAPAVAAQFTDDAAS